MRRRLMPSLMPSSESSEVSSSSAGRPNSSAERFGLFALDIGGEGGGSGSCEAGDWGGGSGSCKADDGDGGAPAQVPRDDDDDPEAFTAATSACIASQRYEHWETPGLALYGLALTSPGHDPKHQPPLYEPPISVLHNSTEMGG
jgi:hypothetical protein